jgi:hypothetical protein
MYDRNTYRFHQNPYQVLIDHRFYIDFVLIFDPSYRKSIQHSVVLSSLDDTVSTPPL